MQQSLSWEANSSSASQEIPHILHNPKVHYHTQKRPLTLPILSQSNPVHSSPFRFLKIHFNNIFPCMPSSSNWSLSVSSSHQNPASTFHVYRTWNSHTIKINIIMCLLDLQTSYSNPLHPLNGGHGAIAPFSICSGFWITKIKYL